MSETEKQALFLLNNISGIDTSVLRKMYDYAGSFEAAAGISGLEYEKAGVFRKKQLINTFDGQISALLPHNKEEYENVKSRGIQMIAFDEAKYPKRFISVEEPPLLLYVNGDLPSENIKTAAVIGSRTCSEYGRSCAKYFSAELASSGIQIISGLAEGIDSCAHCGAISGGGRTFAVLGSGIFVCYPRSNYPLFCEMSEGHGGIISEFSPAANPLPYHFVIRNRLIAGFSDVVIVIEAREKSGTSITVSYALNQGKDVFALPGRITDPLGRGCNRLLKDGAMVLTSPDDVLEYLGQAVSDRNTGGKADNGKTAEDVLPELNPCEKKVYAALDDNPMHIEDISAGSGIDLKTVISVLCSLELKGCAYSPSAAYYRKNHIFNK